MVKKIKIYYRLVSIQGADPAPRQKGEVGDCVSHKYKFDNIVIDQTTYDKELGALKFFTAYGHNVKTNKRIECLFEAESDQEFAAENPEGLLLLEKCGDLLGNELVLTHCWRELSLWKDHQTRGWFTFADFCTYTELNN